MKKMPVLLTFDVDGECLWRCRDPQNAKRPVILSQGRYGPETGVPRILKMLNRYGIHATFFIPGFTVNQYQDLARQIVAEGHELGNHGWSHTYPDNMDGYLLLSTYHKHLCILLLLAKACPCGLIGEHLQRCISLLNPPLVKIVPQITPQEYRNCSAKSRLFRKSRNPKAFDLQGLSGSQIS